MAKTDSTLVTIKFAQEHPRECFWADQFRFERIDGFARVFFGNEGRTEAGISISRDALEAQRDDLGRYMEKFGERVASPSAEMERAQTARILPVDAMHVSNRGAEGEFRFFVFSLHDLATVRNRSEKTVTAHPVMVVRLPFVVLQEIMFKLLDRDDGPQ